MSGSMPLGSDHLVSLPDGTKTDRIELVVTGSEENGN